MARTIAVLIAALLLIAAAPPALVDLTGDYTRFFDATRDVAVPERVARFKATMARRFPGFYTAKRLGIPEARYDAEVARSFDQFPAIEAEFTTRAAAVAGQLADAQADFARTFPDFGAMPPTYLVHSLGEMDGGTRTIGGRIVLIFGADVIARVHRADADERPFFEHELFHVYHQPRFKGCEALWCSVWEEGFATFVAARLNPTAKPDELLMPAADLAAVKARPAAAACAMLASFGSTREDDYNPLFTGRSHLPGLPPRAGYFLGFLVVERLVGEHDMREAANWSPAMTEPRVRAALGQMAGTCPQPRARPRARPSSS